MMTAEETSALLLSVKVGSVAVVVSLPFAIWIAHVLARKEFPGRTLVQGLVDLPLVLPPVVTGYLFLLVFAPTRTIGSWLKTIGIQIAFTWFGAAIAAAVVSFPLMVRAIRGAMDSIDDRFELTARSLGASRLRTFFTITLPLARHGIIAGCLLAFARSIGEFGATIMLAGTFPAKLERFHWRSTALDSASMDSASRGDWSCFSHCVGDDRAEVSGQKLFLPQTHFESRDVFLQFAPSDVTLSQSPADGLSARNRLQGVVRQLLEIELILRRGDGHCAIANQ